MQGGNSEENIGRAKGEKCGPSLPRWKMWTFLRTIDQLSAEGAITVAIDGVFGRWEIGVKEDRRGGGLSREPGFGAKISREAGFWG